MSINTITEFQQAELKRAIKTKINQLNQKFETHLLTCVDLDQFEDLNAMLSNWLILYDRTGSESPMWLLECLAKNDFWAAIKELNFLAKEHIQLDLIHEIVKATKAAEKEATVPAKPASKK